MLRLRDIICLPMVAACVISAANAAPESSQTEAAARDKALQVERLNYVRTQFDRVVTTDPSKEYDVTASFIAPRPIRETAQDASLFELKVTGFRHGDVNRSGGYILKPGEELDEAIAQYEIDAIAFTQRDLEYTEQMLTEASTQAQRRALKQRRIEILEILGKLENEGVMIVGMELQGTGRALKEFHESRPYTFALEVHDPSSQSPIIFPSEQIKRESTQK